ncbi:MAG TPA: hypothetical protein VFC82_08815 [Actinomycetaceae bacterium]|nr:hypothetical protein [Actinomycetaceae bacterium]
MRTVIGLTALALALALLLIVLLTIGRLVYPVFGLQLSGDSLGLLVSATYGALHLALLGFAVAEATGAAKCGMTHGIRTPMGHESCIRVDAAAALRLLLLQDHHSIESGW